MDKETAVEIERLKGKVETLEESRRQWNTLIRNAIVKTVSWLSAVGCAGVLYGWHLPEQVRKVLAEWMSK